MRYRVPLCVSVLLLSCTSTLAFASGGGTVLRTQQTVDTPTVTPTPSPTATSTALPAAAGVLTGANEALKTANTFHTVSRIRLALSGIVDGTVVGTGDVRLKPPATRLHITGNLTLFGKAQKLNENTIQIGKKSWTKDASTHHRWKLDTGTSPAGVSSSNNPLKVLSKGDQVVDVVTMGAATVGSTAVWHLHGTYIAKVDSTHTATGTIDYYIGQVDSLPYEVTAHIADTKLKILEDIDELSTSFAKRVTIKAPRIGSTSP